MHSLVNHILTTLIFVLPACVLANCHFTHNTMTEQLLTHGATVSAQPQADFGRINTSSICHWEAWPHTTQEVSQLVRIAYANNIAIRTQGASHSENGTSLPHANELLIHTTRLNDIHFLSQNRLLADAGVPVLLAKQWVDANTSFIMPIANDNTIASTIGGFISAGGMSSASSKYGGFWEHVRAITLVTANGNILHVKKPNPLFLFLFGSMGQLGIITQAELNLLPNDKKFFTYPLNKSITIPYASTNGYHWTKSSADTPIYWFNLLVPIQKVAEASSDLRALQIYYPHALNYIPLYHWQIQVISPPPPLIYDKQQSFCMIGLWGTKANFPDSHTALMQLENAFSALVLQKKYKRYIQAEISASPRRYQNYFSPAVLLQFQQLKSATDPKFLFNRGSFFAS